MAARRINRPPDHTGPKIKPRASDLTATSYDGLTPVFCLRHLADGWSVSDCERDDRAAFAVTIEKLSKLTWQQIKGAPRHGVGAEKIASHSIKAPIPGSVTEDVQFLAFRFNGKKSMVGFRSGGSNVFHIIWLDPRFKLYDHN